jgi:hypothetical protein
MCGGIPGQAFDPGLAVGDVHLLLFEDAVNHPPPRPIAALVHVQKLMTGSPVHAEVEHHEVGPGLDGVVEDVHPLVTCRPHRPQVLIARDAEGEIGLADLLLGIDAQVGQQPVHDPGMAHLILDDGRHRQHLWHSRGLDNPGDVAEAAGQLGICLHLHQIHEVRAVLLAHLLGRLDGFPGADLLQQVFVLLFLSRHPLSPRSPVGMEGDNAPPYNTGIIGRRREGPCGPAAEIQTPQRGISSANVRENGYASGLDTIPFLTGFAAI